MSLRQRVLFAFALVSISALAGCSPGSPTDVQWVAAAERDIAENKVDAAVAALKYALIANGNNPRARWLLGTLLVDLGDGATAEKELRRSKSLGMSSELVMPELAEALLRQGKLNEVIVLSPEPAFSPKATAQMLVSKAEAYLAKGDISQARDNVAAALKRSPDSSTALTTQAKILLASGQSAEAMALLHKAVNIMPAYAPAWSIIGQIEAKENRLEKASDALTKAIDNRLDDSADRLLRVLVNISLHQLEAAKTDVDALKAHGFALAPLGEGLIAFQNGQYQDAIDSLTTVLNQYPNHVASLYFSALANLMLGNAEQALAQASRVFSLRPDYVPGRKLLALLKARQKDFETAEGLLRPVVHHDGDDVLSTQLLASTLLQSGKYNDAIALLEPSGEPQPASANEQPEIDDKPIGGGRTAKESSEPAEAPVGLDPEVRRGYVLLILSQIGNKQFDQALTAAEDLRRRDPASPVAENLLGRIYLAKDDEKNAEAAWRRANEIAPGDTDANTHLAALALQRERLPEARQHYQAILDHHPDNVGALVRLAQLDATEGNISAMEAHLREAVSADPVAVVPRLLLARYRLQQNRVKDAMELLAPVEDRAQDNPEFLVTLTTAQLMDGSPETAKSTVQQLLRRAPKSAAAHFLSARVAAGTGDAAAVNDELAESVKLDPNFFEARLAYTRLLLLQKRYALARESLAVLQKTHPDRPEVKVLVGLAAMESQSEQSDEAEKVLAEVFAAAPSPMTALALALEKWRSGERSDAITLLQKWVRTHPKDAKARFALANFLVSSGQREDGVAQYRRIVEQAPDNALALNQLAWNLLRVDPKAALGYAKRAAELQPEAPEVLDTYAFALATNGDLASAKRSAEKALAKQPQNPTFQYRKAMILDMQGKQQEAMTVLEDLLKDSRLDFEERPEAQALADKIRNQTPPAQ